MAVGKHKSLIPLSGKTELTGRWQEKVFVSIDESLDYPENPPFSPPQTYPESPFRDHTDPSNRVYASVRELFKMMDFDRVNRDSPGWSPLSEVVHEGDTVMVKPNLVYDKNLNGESVFAVVTHASVIRAVIDYAYKATGDGGKVIVADTPQHAADFEGLMQVTGLKETVEYLKENYSLPLELYDLRKERVWYDGNVVVDRKPLSGDPKGYVGVDLGKRSMLSEIDSDYKKFVGADYNRKLTTSMHKRGRHNYIISRTILESDVIINVPKFKTHLKTAITMSLKNMIGIVGEKNTIVHFRVGNPTKGGDEYPDWTPRNTALLIWLNRKFSDIFLSRNIGLGMYRKMLSITGGESGIDSQSGRAKIVHSGNWCGNDTTWRTVADTVRIALYSDKNGQVHTSPQRRMFILADGIVGGEGQGPLGAHPRRCGTLICGANPWKVDLVGARLMGFDEKKIPLISRGNGNFTYEDLNVVMCANNKNASGGLGVLPNLHFKSARTWDHVYLSPQ